MISDAANSLPPAVLHTLGGQRIAVYDRTARPSTNDALAIVFVHGNSASAHAFAAQFAAPVLAAHRLIAFDLPGHGNSDDAGEPARTYCLAAYAEILRDVLRVSGIERAVFVGWSLGGHIVLEAAARLPEAQGYLIFGTPPLTVPPPASGAFRSHPAMAVTFAAEADATALGTYVDAFFAPTFFRADDPARQRLRDALIASALRADGRARAYLGASMQQQRYLDEVRIVAELSRPLAILHGGQESFVDGEWFNRLQLPTLWRGAIQWFPDAGHAPQFENSTAFNRMLEAFARDCA